MFQGGSFQADFLQSPCGLFPVFPILVHPDSHLFNLAVGFLILGSQLRSSLLQLLFCFLNFPQLSFQLPVFQIQILIGFPNLLLFILQLADAHLMGILYQRNLMAPVLQFLQLLMLLCHQPLIKLLFFFNTVSCRQCLLADCLQFFNLPLSSQEIAGIFKCAAGHGSACT